MLTYTGRYGQESETPISSYSLMTRKAAELLHGILEQLRGSNMRCGDHSKQRLHQRSLTLGSQAKSVTLSVLLGNSKTSMGMSLSFTLNSSKLV